MRGVASWLFGSVWLSAVAGGFWAWERYDATPGPAGASTVATDATGAGNWRLTVFAHPRCPCTRATLAAAADIAGAAPEVGVRVLFVRPPGSPEGWERGDSWELATRIPGAEVACDTDTAARRFGAETSGHAILTDPSGRVVFRGGLTPARGRAGEGVGRRAVLDWVSGRSGPATAPVFGCPLFNHDD